MSTKCEPEGRGQECPSNARPGSAFRAEFELLYENEDNLNIGEVAEWLKALPC